MDSKMKGYIKMYKKIKKLKTILIEYHKTIAKVK